MDKQKITDIRRIVNDSSLGRFVNDRVLGVFVDASSLSLYSILTGKNSMELSSNQLYSSYTRCFGKSVSEIPSNIFLGIADSLKNFNKQRLFDGFVKNY